MTDANGSVTYTSAVKLTVKTSITGQPLSVSAAAGATVKFAVKATGADLTYQWQFRGASGQWNTCSLTGSKTATLSVPVINARNGIQYRCVITDANGKTTCSNAATLTVK
jgi:hypothetical protein